MLNFPKITWRIFPRYREFLKKKNKKKTDGLKFSTMKTMYPRNTEVAPNDSIFNAILYCVAHVCAAWSVIAFQHMLDMRVITLQTQRCALQHWCHHRPMKRMFPATHDESLLSLSRLCPPASDSVSFGRWTRSSAPCTRARAGRVITKASRWTTCCANPVWSLHGLAKHQLSANLIKKDSQKITLTSYSGCNA